MMDRLSIKVEDKALRRAIRQAPHDTIRAIHKALLRSAIFTQSQFRKNLKGNIGATGHLSRGVQYRFRNLVSVDIHPTAPYAEFVEYGTKPHWTSVKNLERWARIKGVNPYALQRSIAHKGTKAHPYLEKTRAMSDRFARREMEKEISKLTETI